MSSPGPKRYDAFLSYNSQDRPAVREVAERLRGEGLVLYLDEWELAPGREFQSELARALLDSKACVVFLGPSGLAPWQMEELQVAIDTRVRDRDFHVIPVLLPGAERPRRGEVAHLEFLINASWVEFVRTLDEEPVLRRLLWGITGRKPAEPAGPQAEGVCPYRGLEAFGPDDARFFFGRENLTGWLVSDLRREIHAARGTRLLAVLGPSGSGKSSVVLAGLIPRLRASAIEGSERWTVAIVRPGDDPLENLAVEMTVPFRPAGAMPDLGQVQRLSDDLQGGERGLDRFARLAMRDAPGESRLIVVVDQFEEIFTYRPQDDQARGHFERSRAMFLANLLHAASTPGGPVVAILTMRSDFLGACAGFPRLNDALHAHLVQVGPMRSEELREAIERPAYLVGCEVEPSLTERLLADVAGQPGALPLLQFALTEVWKRRDVRRLKLLAYEELGGVQGALEKRANDIYASLGEDQKRVCKEIFLSLVQLGEGTEDTKRRVTYRELLPDDPDQADRFREVIEKLADPDVRLIATDKRFEARKDAARENTKGSDEDEGGLEVAHEALIRGWKQLREWVDADRDGLRTKRRLTEAAGEWSKATPESKDGYLYRDAWLAVASKWAEGKQLGPIERTFLTASQEAERHRREKEIEVAKRLAEAEAERARQAEQLAEHASSALETQRRTAEAQRRLSRRLLVAAGVAVLLAVTAGGLGLLANSARNSAETASGEKGKALAKAIEAQKTAREAEERAKSQTLIAEKNARVAESRRIAALADVVRLQRLDQAMLLALEASHVEDTLESRGCLLRVLDTRPEVAHFLHIPEGHVTSVASGPDGRLAVGFGRDGVGGVVFFDARGRRLRLGPLEVKEGDITSVAFGPDGRLAAGFARDGASGVVLFDARGGRPWPGPLEVKEGKVTSVAFGPDGRLAVGFRHSAGGVVLFDARGERLGPEPLEVKEGGVVSVAFGPDGRLAAGFARILSGSGVVLFDARGERLGPEPLQVKEGYVMSVAFGPDGRLAAGFGTMAVRSVGPFGVMLFDARGEQLRPGPLEVREGPVTSLAFGPDGRLAVGFERIVGGGGGVVLFDARGERLRPGSLEVKEGKVTSVAFGPEGRLAAGYYRDDDGGVVLFDLLDERLRLRTLEVKEGDVTSVAYGSDGRLAAGYDRDDDGGVVLFDSRGERLRPGPLGVKEGKVTSVAFGPAGRLAAGYYRDDGGGVVLFDARGGRSRPGPLEVKEGCVWSVTFGLDGRLAAGFGRDDGGGVVLFDARGGRSRPGPLEVKEGGVRGVAFGPAGRLAAAFGRVGGGVVLFDARGERSRQGPLEVKEHGVSDVAFGSGGRLAAGFGDVGFGDGEGGVALFDAQGERSRLGLLEVNEGYVTSVAFGPDDRLAAGFGRVILGDGDGGVVLFNARGERTRPRPLEVKEGHVTSVAFGPGGRLAAGFHGRNSSGVMLFDVDEDRWRRQVEQVANRNLTRAEWEQFFPESLYRRTIRFRPWPHDLSEDERKQAEAWEREHPDAKGAA